MNRGALIPSSASVKADPTLPGTATFWMPRHVDDSLGYFHGTRAIVNVDPGLARSVGVVERRLVALTDRLSADPARFEEVAAAIEFFNQDADEVEPELEGVENELWDCFSGEVGDLERLDLGMAGLVMALAAVGTVPAASCRGHRGLTAWSAHPIVMVAVDRGHAAWLQPLVKATGCGFDWDDERPDLLCIVAPSILHTMGLAERILAEAELRWPTDLTRTVVLEGSGDGADFDADED